MKPFILLSMTLACLAQGVTSWAVEMPAKWAFEPLREVAVPVGEGHPIDGFVRQRLAKAGLAQNGTATPGALVRRLHFNLIGLPPEPEVIRSFEQNPTGEAYLKLMDELLASPLYGERWARHWLDVARYGESNGFEYNEPRRNAWPYRDWVLDALTADMPDDECNWWVMYSGRARKERRRLDSSSRECTTPCCRQTSCSSSRRARMNWGR